MGTYGSLAQLVERHVYTVDVIGSIPVGPTANPGTARCRGFCVPVFADPAFTDPVFANPVFADLLTCREGMLRGARWDACEDNPAGTAIPSSIKLHSTYI